MITTIHIELSFCQLTSNLMGINTEDLPLLGAPSQREQAKERMKSLIQRGKLSSQGYLPSIREAANLIGFNRDAVWRAYIALEKEGYIENYPQQTIHNPSGCQKLSPPHPRCSAHNRRRRLDTIFRFAAISQNPRRKRIPLRHLHSFEVHC